MGVSSIYLRQIERQNITTSGNGQPNWSYIPSAAKSSKSQSEFIQEIKSLAQKAAATTNEYKLDSINKQVLRLKTEYVSEVSPDRKALFQSAGNVMKRGTTGMKYNSQGEKTLLDFLEGTNKEKDLAERRFALSGGGFLTCPILSGGGHGVVIQYGNTQVLSNLGSGWGYQMTPAELAKSQEFYSIYWKEYRSIKNDSEIRELPDYLEQKSAFDKKA